jgi:hypothetical protein
MVVLGTKQKGRRASLVGRGGVQLAPLVLLLLLLGALLLLGKLLLQCRCGCDSAGHCECLRHPRKHTIKLSGGLRCGCEDMQLAQCKRA